MAKVKDGKVAGAFKPAGVWYLAGGNTCVYSNPKGELGATQHVVQTSNRRFRDDEFLVARKLTSGQSEGSDSRAVHPCEYSAIPRLAPARVGLERTALRRVLLRAAACPWFVIDEPRGIAESWAHHGNRLVLMKHRFSLASFPSGPIIAACLLGAALLSGGCHKSDTKPEPGKPKVALVMKSLANEFFGTMAEGARKHQAANAATYELLVNGIKNETDLAEQVNLVEQMIARQVNAIVIAPADSKALVTVLKRAKEAGILVVNIDNKLDADVLKQAGLVKCRLSGRTTAPARARWARRWPGNSSQETKWPSSKASPPPLTASSGGLVSRTP